MAVSISGDGIISGITTLTTGNFITTESISAPTATFTGNVSIGGTLTTEDVTNIDSVGLITARSGIQVTGGSVVVGSAVTLSSGGVSVAGVITSTSAIVGSAVTLSSGGVSVAGIVTANSFRGDGSQLTNLNIPQSFNELDAALFN